jgi:hypothetical protein
MKHSIKKFGLAVILTAFTAALSVPLFAQGPRVDPVLPGNLIAEPAVELHPSAVETSEKVIAVDKNVNISMCVTQGKLKINGWNRAEARVFVSEGAKFTFKVLEKNKEGKPVWIGIAGIEGVAGKNDCIWGDEIEIDVPVGAVINMKGQETQTTIDTVRKANVKTIGGDITVRNAANGVMASTYEGDVTVEQSHGSMSLESTTGNIVVFDVGPSDIGDILKAKTNSGMISLQSLEHREVEVGSITGSIAFNGEILSGGTYSLTTSNGSIRLTLPQSTSCDVSALYGFGAFNTELPMKIITENISPGPVKMVNGSIGKGGAKLKLTTNNGSIAIKKQ